MYILVRSETYSDQTLGRSKTVLSGIVCVQFPNEVFSPFADHHSGMTMKECFDGRVWGKEVKELFSNVDRLVYTCAHTDIHTHTHTLSIFLSLSLWLSFSHSLSLSLTHTNTNIHMHAHKHTHQTDACRLQLAE